VVRKGGKEGAGRNSGMTVELEYLHSYVCWRKQVSKANT
jgi:hypothetical protein